MKINIDFIKFILLKVYKNIFDDKKDIFNDK